MKNKKFRINILLKGKDKEKDKVIVIDGDVYVSDSIVIEGENDDMIIIGVNDKRKVFYKIDKDKW